VPEPLHLLVRNNLNAITQATVTAVTWLRSLGVSETVEFFVSLTIEEVVTNCIKYGYDDAADHDIEIRLGVHGEMLTMEVFDDGHPFNPLNEPPPDITADIDHRPIGGLGIYLFREMSDGIKYCREDNKNHLTLLKKLS
jgi:anti-sigma regulatory factor (Ser/Thr protein kinase)